MRYVVLAAVWLAFVAVCSVALWLFSPGGTPVATADLPANKLLEAADLKTEPSASIRVLAGHYLVHPVARGEAVSMANVAPSPVYAERDWMTALPIQKSNLPGLGARVRLCDGERVIADGLSVRGLQCSVQASAGCVVLLGFPAALAGKIAAETAATADLQVTGATCKKVKP